ncbi:hypothetical protein ACFOY2_46040 [Nonomuraea purpurea]|uniref:HTH cro/C1-type domain-containing protein n=1 Tax=Nonomuraea purpurea TaxID=1849276 RepID=A0ABV8GR36_9ACTN
MPLKSRLKRLREESVNPATGEPYSQREAAAAITAAGTPITGAYLAMLEGGERTKLSLDKALGVARFYGVPVEYLSTSGDNAEHTATSEPQLLLLTQRLNRLFDVVVDPVNRKPYPLDRAAEAITATGSPITEAQLAELRTGEEHLLTVAQAAAIARFFGVPGEYLTASASAQHAALVERVDSQLDLLQAILTSGTQDLALRSAELSSEGRRKIARLIEKTRAEEGLPADREVP